MPLSVQATYEEARDYFARAEALDPNFWAANQLHLGISESKLGHTCVRAGLPQAGVGEWGKRRAHDAHRRADAAAPHCTVTPVTTGCSP